MPSKIQCKLSLDRVVRLRSKLFNFEFSILYHGVMHIMLGWMPNVYEQSIFVDDIYVIRNHYPKWISAREFDWNVFQSFINALWFFRRSQNNSSVFNHFLRSVFPILPPGKSDHNWYLITAYCLDRKRFGNHFLLSYLFILSLKMVLWENFVWKC